MNIREDPDLIAVSIRLALPRGSTEAKENLARLSARLSCSHAPSTSPTDDRMIGLLNRGDWSVRRSSRASTSYGEREKKSQSQRARARGKRRRLDDTCARDKELEFECNYHRPSSTLVYSRTHGVMVGCQSTQPALSPNQRAISRSADSTESEP